MSEPLWDWERIDIEMEKAYKAHADTYQFLWVRELLRQVCSDMTDQLATLQAATLSAQSVAVIREAILVRYENSGDAYWPLLDKAKEEFRALTQYPAQKPTHAETDRVEVDAPYAAFELSCKNIYEAWNT